MKEQMTILDKTILKNKKKLTETCFSIYEDIIKLQYVQSTLCIDAEQLEQWLRLENPVSAKVLMQKLSLFKEVRVVNEGKKCKR